MEKNKNYIGKLGMFVILGLVLFVVTIYFIGKNQNLFGSTIRLNAQFKNVSGLKVGNNVRFSGINIGTVKEIAFVSDSAVMVKMVVEQDVQKYIKADAHASIGSDGLMGDKILTISPGTSSNKMVKDNAVLASSNAIEVEDLMKSLKKSIDNAEIITSELAIFTGKMNNDKSILGKLVNNDEKLGKSVDATIRNVQRASEKMNEIGEAAKHNFLLKGYFKKQKKAEDKKKAELEKAALEKKK
jgi:phospholipid/cholesterol/gamma-HCH transport system substrate-binding protein